ncbi:hypothetical protein SAMN04488523_11575 [Sulfitobacter brevis]|uniref:Uncharacterized protein n=1 Tax=Sulfitobacter brevis TaxID=74348 RepID=A0A1I2FE01_9RHOB|nr:hypothetical protein [Sulfitobacter brevis]SFF03475.1 hypothetical protein SAMN04488523_11575 [Sulfitobacter brevis]
MEFWPVLIFLYVVITIFAITMTYREQKKREDVTPMFALIGCILCTVWPLVVAAILLYSKLFTVPREYTSG